MRNNMSNEKFQEEKDKEYKAAWEKMREDCKLYGFSRNPFAEYYKKYGPPIFEVPKEQIYCEQCETTNYFYDDSSQPFRCDRCGVELISSS